MMKIDLEAINQMPWKTRDIFMAWCKENDVPGYLFQLNWAPHYITCFKYKGSEKNFGFVIGKKVVEKIRVRTKSPLPIEVLEFVK